MLDEDARVQDVLRWCVEQRDADRLVLISRVDTDLPGRQLFAPRVDASVLFIFAAIAGRLVRVSRGRIIADTRDTDPHAWIFESGEVPLPRAEEIPWDNEILDYVPSAPDFLRLAHMKR